jgi:uncharacterized protein (UPF0262 family)
MPKSRIEHVSIEDMQHAAGLIARDREIALKDLKINSQFQPVKDDNGPYEVKLSSEENRLIFHIKNADGADLPLLVLSMKPYSRLIKDYFIIVQSYDEAVKDGKPSRIEAIDMGRRALHNEGAALLMERMADKIKMDLDTARKLFTLICVLHTEKVHILR